MNTERSIQTKSSVVVRLAWLAASLIAATAAGTPLAAADTTPTLPRERTVSQLMDPTVGDEPNRVYSETLPASVPRACKFLQSAHSQTTQRESSGLTSSALNDRTVEVLGMLVTDAEALAVKSASEAQDSISHAALDAAVRNSLGSAYIGTYWEATTGFKIAHQPVEDVERISANVARIVGINSRHLTFVEVAFGVSAGSRKANIKAIGENARELAALGMRQTFTDESCGHMVVYAEIASDVSELNSALGRVLQEGSFSTVQFDSVSDTDFEGARTDYQAPYIGGSSISLPLSCTSSIGWRKPNGEQWAVSAAHCVGNINPDPRAAYWHLFTQQRNWTQGGTSLNNTRGFTTYLAYGGRLDVAVTWMNPGLSAQPKTIYSTSASPAVDLTRVMDGWQSSSNADVATDENPWGYPGDTVCHSGRNWNWEKCGTLLTKEITQTGVSSLTGLWSHFHDLRQVSTTHKAGDSGGTVWEKEGDGDLILAGVSRGPGGSTGGNLVYSHVSYIPSVIGLQKPQGL